LTRLVCLAVVIPIKQREASKAKVHQWLWPEYIMATGIIFFLRSFTMLAYRDRMLVYAWIFRLHVLMLLFYCEESRADKKNLDSIFLKCRFIS
jgi:hypothetical protein